jgi:hypothetical protein
MHSVGRGTGTPKDRDEAPRAPFCCLLWSNKARAEQIRKHTHFTGSVGPFFYLFFFAVHHFPSPQRTSSRRVIFTYNTILWKHDDFHKIDAYHENNILSTHIDVYLHLILTVWGLTGVQDWGSISAFSRHGTLTIARGVYRCIMYAIVLSSFPSFWLWLYWGAIMLIHAHIRMSVLQACSHSLTLSVTGSIISPNGLLAQ